MISTGEVAPLAAAGLLAPRLAGSPAASPVSSRRANPIPHPIANLQPVAGIQPHSLPPAASPVLQPGWLPTLLKLYGTG